MNVADKQLTEAPRCFDRTAVQLVTQVLFERSRFGRHAHEGSRVTVERLLERLSYRRTNAHRRRRGR